MKNIHNEHIFKWIVIGITGIAILIAGISYTRQYSDEETSELVMAEESATAEAATTETVAQTELLSENRIAADGTALTEKTSDSSDGQQEADQTSARQEALCVYICGAVTTPEVYRVSDGARIRDVVEAAGGLLSDANPNCVNQAETVYDGEMIYIPYEGETLATGSPGNSGSTGSTGSGGSSGNGGSAGGSGSADSALININTADADTLMELPGIGESKAESIITYRTEHGAFSDISQITNVSGIGDSIFERIKDSICI